MPISETAAALELVTATPEWRALSALHAIATANELAALRRVRRLSTESLM